MTEEQIKIKKQGEEIKAILREKDRNGSLRDKLIRDIISNNRQEVLNDLLLISKEVDNGLYIIDYILSNEEWETESIVFANAIN